MICSSVSSTSSTDLGYGATLGVAVDDMSCELEELLYLLLLKVKALSAPRQRRRARGFFAIWSYTNFLPLP